MLLTGCRRRVQSSRVVELTWSKLGRVLRGWRQWNQDGEEEEKVDQGIKRLR